MERRLLLCLASLALAQISLGHVLIERQARDGLDLGPRDRLANRGVTYIKAPSSAPAPVAPETEVRRPSGDGQRPNYAIFEEGDERDRGRGATRVAAGPSAPLPPSPPPLPPKFGPVLFPDEEPTAAAVGGSDKTQGNRTGENSSGAVKNSPTGQGSKPTNQNTSGTQPTREPNRNANSDRNKAGNSGGSGSTSSSSNNNKNNNNPNSANNSNRGNNNGRTNSRIDCLLPLNFFYCMING